MDVLWRERADPTVEQAPAGFASLYREQYGPMVRLAYLLTDSNAIAEELVQDAFVRVYQRWAHVDNAPAYLRRAVVNACRSHHRRRFLERRNPAEPPPPVELPEPDGMWELLAELPPRRRAALVLRFYEDLQVRDIAVALGCSPGTVKSLIHRGLAQLRKGMDP